MREMIDTSFSSVKGPFSWNNKSSEKLVTTKKKLTKLYQKKKKSKTPPAYGHTTSQFGKPIAKSLTFKRKSMTKTSSSKNTSPFLNTTPQNQQ
jgi:hypothetical protein